MVSFFHQNDPPPPLGQSRRSRLANGQPVIASSQPSDDDVDSDAAFMKPLLGLETPETSLCPVIANQSELVNQVREAYNRIAPEKGVVIIEGMFEPGLIQALDARVIAVEAYSDEPPRVKSGSSYRELDKNLLGVVLNKVPAKLNIV